MQSIQSDSNSASSAITDISDIISRISELQGEISVGIEERKVVQGTEVSIEETETASSSTKKTVRDG